MYLMKSLAKRAAPEVDIDEESPANKSKYEGNFAMFRHFNGRIVTVVKFSILFCCMLCNMLRQEVSP